jgi:hypothetical protein
VDIEDFYALHADLYMTKNYETLMVDWLQVQNTRKFQIIGYAQYAELRKKISSRWTGTTIQVNEKIMS